jgi:hypothetical protein
MTTLLSSRGATEGRSRCLILNRCVDADPEADPSPPPPRCPALHPPRAPPPRPPPQSHVLRRRSPQAPQPLSPPSTLHAPPRRPAPSSPHPKKWDEKKSVNSYCKMV